MIRLFRYLRGYAVFCVGGGFADRFLNLCRLRGIVLWNVKYEDDKVFGFTLLENLPLLTDPVKNSGMELLSAEKHGLRCFLKDHKRRAGALAGLFITAVCLFLLSQTVWDVVVPEIDGVNAEAFTASLADLGVKRGAFKRSIDIPAVQRQLLNKYASLVWVSVNIFGSRVEVEVIPVEPEPETVDLTTPTNVVAAKAGKITLIERGAGTQTVKTGAFVSKGELLLAGVVTYRSGAEHLTHAHGHVFAETKSEFSASVPAAYRTVVTGTARTVYRPYFFGLSLPLGVSRDGALPSAGEWYARGGDAILPVGVQWRTVYGCAPAAVTLTPAEQFCLALESCAAQKRAELAAAEITGCRTAVSEDGGATSVTVTVDATEDIALLVPIDVDPGTPTTPGETTELPTEN